MGIKIPSLNTTFDITAIYQKTSPIYPCDADYFIRVLMKNSKN